VTGMEPPESGRQKRQVGSIGATTGSGQEARR
jgi:hypothetical protein